MRRTTPNAGACSPTPGGSSSTTGDESTTYEGASTVAVTDLNTLIAGMIGPPTVIGKDATTAEAAGIPHTPWYAAGLIGAGAAPGGGLNGATFSGTTNGAIAMPS